MIHVANNKKAQMSIAGIPRPFDASDQDFLITLMIGVRQWRQTQLMLLVGHHCLRFKISVDTPNDDHHDNTHHCSSTAR